MVSMSELKKWEKRIAEKPPRLVKEELEKALEKAKIPERLFLLCYLCEVTEKLGDYVLQYKTAHEAVSILRTGGNFLPKQWISNLHVIFAHSAMLLGEFDVCEKEYLQAVETKQTLHEKLDIMTSYILASHYQSYDSAIIWKRQQMYAGLIENIQPLPPVTRVQQAKIRVGYLSPNFHRHAMFPIYLCFFAAYNRKEFSVTGYQLNCYADECTRKLKNLADGWREVYDLSYEEIARLIREDEIDILVDLASHLAGTGLPVLAFRPARVHISGLGSLCSTGVKAVDYYITDEAADPPGLHDAYFAETPLYLPAQFSYSAPVNAPEVTGAPCRRNGYITLGVFQFTPKITEPMLQIWKDILTALPSARLLLKSGLLNNSAYRDIFLTRLQKCGLPLERVDLECESGYEEYMQRLQSVDIMLDTYPYTGGSTTLDALYMGVPTVTLYGERRNTRFGLSILRCVGLDELAADSPDGYRQRVIALAGDWEVLDLLHRNLRNMMMKSDSCPERYMKHVENAYRQMLGR